MKKLLITLGIAALTSITLQAANCGPSNTDCSSCSWKNTDCGSPGFYDSCDKLIPYDDYSNCCFDLKNWYLAVRGTVTWNEDLKITSSDIFLRMRLNQKTGGGLSVALGYNINQCMRFEIEGLYHRNSVQCINLTNPCGSSLLIAEPTGDKSVNGAIQDAALMGNFFYDYTICPCTQLFVGAGAGITFNRMRISTINTSTGKVTFEQFFANMAGTFPGQATELNSVCPSKCHTYFAWNIMGGLSYELSPCWVIEVGYRLFAKNKIKFNQQLFCKSKIPITHAVVAGLRYKF